MHPNEYSIDIVASFEKDIDTSIGTIMELFSEFEKGNVNNDQIRDIIE